MAAHVSTVQNSRLRTMVIPREHGAWGMMLVPLATGAVVALRTGVNGGALTLFILAAMSLFWLRTPVEAWLGTSAIKAQTRTGTRVRAQSDHPASLARRSQHCGAAVEWPQSRAAADWRGRGPRIRGASGGEEARAQRPNAGASHRRDRADVNCSGRVLRRHRASSITSPSRSGWPTGCSPATRFISCRCAFAPAVQSPWTRSCSKGFPSSPDRSVLIGVDPRRVPLRRLSHGDRSGVSFRCCFAERCGSCAAASRWMCTSSATANWASVDFRRAAVRGVPGVIVLGCDSPISEVVLLQPLAGDTFHGLIPVIGATVLRSPGAAMVRRKRRKAPAPWTASVNWARTLTVGLFVGEVLHHPPLVDVDPVRQRQHAVVFQRPFDFRQRLAHPIGRVVPIVRFSDTASSSLKVMISPESGSR